MAKGYFPPIFVISIAGNPRRDLCTDQLNISGSPFAFFDAIDGSLLDDDAAFLLGYDPTSNRRSFKRPLTLAEVGCYVSHKSLWQQIATSKRPAIVLEDDFQLEAGFRENIAHLLQFNVTDKIIKIDSRPSKRVRRGATAQILGAVTMKQYLIVAPRTTGYVIGPRAAARMLDVRQRFYRPVDIDLKFWWEHSVPIMTAEPPLVRERLVEREHSLIGPGRKAIKSKNPLKRLVRNLRYQASFKYNMIRHSLPGALSWRGGSDE